MADLRTVAVQVTEDLFSRLKAVLAKNGMKQKDFLIGLIEEALKKRKPNGKRNQQKLRNRKKSHPKRNWKKLSLQNQKRMKNRS